MKAETQEKFIFFRSVFLKYGIFLFLPLFYLLLNKNDVPNRYSIEAAELILVMLPMVFTIISIALSLQSENIYGITSMRFRRLRGNTSFSFLEMIIITIFIFVIYTIFKIFDYLLLIWVLDVIAVFYGIYFICQEVPILERRNDRMVDVIKKAIRINLDKSLNSGNSSKGSDLITVIQNLILKNGIVFSYNALKRKELDAEMLDFLLSKSNEYFFDCVDRVELFKNGIIKSYKGINLVDAITMAFTNLDVLLNLNKDCNIVKIYGNPNSFYHVTRLVFCLQKIASSLSLIHLFNESMERLLVTVFLSNYNATDDEKTFQYLTLNALLIESISDDDLWFLELIRDSNYSSRFCIGNNTGYYYFVSMYLYYICTQKDASAEVKEKIKRFLQEEANGLNADGSSWMTIIKHNQRYLSVKNLVSLLPQLLLIKGDDSRFPIWYKPKRRLSWTIEKEFSDEFIFDCWFETIINNHQVSIYSESITISSMLLSLPEKVQLRIARELNLKWFKENRFVGIDKIDSFLSFYGAADRCYLNEENNDLIKEIKNFKHNKLFAHLKEELDNVPKTPEKLGDVKKWLLDGFNTIIKDVPILDVDLQLDGQSILCSDILLDSCMTEEMIKNYAEQQSPLLIDRLVYNAIKNSNGIPIEKLSKIDDAGSNLLNKYKFRAGNIYALHQKISDNDIQCLLKIPEIDIASPYILLFKKDAIKMNMQLEKDLSVVRWLNPNEINYIIDRDYKAINGLYKFSNYHDDAASVFVTREEIFRLVKEKYLYANIVYKFRLYLDIENLLRLDSENDEEAE